MLFKISATISIFYCADGNNESFISLTVFKKDKTSSTIKEIYNRFSVRKDKANCYSHPVSDTKLVAKLKLSKKSHIYTLG